jgi:aminoglycoside 6-adenylyltransferase
VVKNGEQDTEAVLQRLVRWADPQDAVRALLLTSTRAIPHAPVDDLSDYDVILVARDIRQFVDDRGWAGDFGTVLVAYWDPLAPDPDYGVAQAGNVVQYADGLKIDFRLWPVALLHTIAQSPALPPELDAGYRVLLDKDGLVAQLRPPSYRAYVPARPSEEIYLALIEEFFNDAPYVAKYLWRGELLPAKWCLDCDMKHVYLRRMLEWRMERDHDWSVPARNLGKGLERRLPVDLRARLASTYAGGGIAENWAALFGTMTLFRDVALAVAADLGYTYPHDLDERVTAYVRSIQGRERDVTSDG